MTVIGSYKDDKGFDPENVAAMCHHVTRQSVDKLRDLVKDETPVLTGALEESIHTTPTRKRYKSWYQADVQTEDPKAKWIEYGTPPHIIRPRAKKALDFGGEHPYNVVHHPGYEGAHMFQRGASVFEHLYAERIAKAGLRVFLGARTTV